MVHPAHGRPATVGNGTGSYPLAAKQIEEAVSNRIIMAVLASAHREVQVANP
jgi:hypothetical protein